MSKNSAKSNYTQLIEWLSTRKQVTVKTANNQKASPQVGLSALSSTRFSKADAYNGKASRV